MAIEHELIITARFKDAGAKQGMQELTTAEKNLATAGKTTTTAQTGSNKVWDKATDAIDKVTVRKKQLIGVMSQVASTAGNVTQGLTGIASSAMMVATNLGPMGMIAGGVGMAVASFVEQEIKAAEASRQAAAAFIQQSDSMKEMGYGAIAYATQLSDLIKKQQEVGKGIVLSGGGAGGEAVAGIRAEIVRSLEEKMIAEGKSRGEIAILLKNNKAQIDTLALTTQALAEQEKRLTEVQGRGVEAQLLDNILMKDFIGTGYALKEAEASTVAAYTQHKDALEALSRQFGDLVPFMGDLTSFIAGLPAEWRNYIRGLLPKNAGKIARGKGVVQIAGTKGDTNADWAYESADKPGVYVKHEGNTAYYYDEYGNLTGSITDNTPPGGRGAISGGGGGGGGTTNITPVKDWTMERMLAREAEQQKRWETPYKKPGLTFAESSEKDVDEVSSAIEKKAKADIKAHKDAAKEFAKNLQDQIGDAVGQGLAEGLKPSNNAEAKRKAMKDMMISIAQVFAQLIPVPGVGQVVSGLLGAFKGASGAYMGGGHFEHLGGFAGGGFVPSGDWSLIDWSNGMHATIAEPGTGGEWIMKNKQLEATVQAGVRAAGGGGGNHVHIHAPAVISGREVEEIVRDTARKGSVAHDRRSYGEKR